MTQILAIFDTPKMTAEQYDLVDKELRALGLVEPEGRLHHVAAATENGWCVVDVWQSGDSLDQFSKVLMPVLEKNGVEPAQPRIYPVHNLITGE